jgi:hypothetical protein
MVPTVVIALMSKESSGREIRSPAWLNKRKKESPTVVRELLSLKEFVGREVSLPAELK